MNPEAGLVLGGRYELQTRIAVGGMGEVWVAMDQHLHRQVAAKVLRAEFAGDKAFLDRLRTEARNSARLSHQNIAAMYDYGEQTGSGYLIMELVRGEPLAELLLRERTLEPEQLLGVLAQTARALHSAHMGGVVHRDVKPSNILLTRDGYVKITDFGISLSANQAPMTAAGMVMGTAQYLPPEQAMGRPATGAGDIYALGVVAYEALVGRRPFTGSSQVDIAFAHVNQSVPAMPERIDPRVRAVVMQMLEKDPERRPRSAASLARALEELAAHLDVAVEPDGDALSAVAVTAPAAAPRAVVERVAEPGAVQRPEALPPAAFETGIVEPAAVEPAVVEPAPVAPAVVEPAPVAPAAQAPEPDQPLRWHRVGPVGPGRTETGALARAPRGAPAHLAEPVEAAVPHGRSEPSHLAEPSSAGHATAEPSEPELDYPAEPGHAPEPSGAAEPVLSAAPPAPPSRRDLRTGPDTPNGLRRMTMDASGGLRRRASGAAEMAQQATTGWVLWAVGVVALAALLTVMVLWLSRLGDAAAGFAVAAPILWARQGRSVGVTRVKDRTW